jgi:hypothetical protein
MVQRYEGGGALALLPHEVKNAKFRKRLVKGYAAPIPVRPTTRVPGIESVLDHPLQTLRQVWTALLTALAWIALAAAVISAILAAAALFVETAAAAVVAIGRAPPGA